ncbi:plastocyanin/azurin family copper-binding protein [Notoacmeibacter ruber]|nr:plastocyanin/azurin family copper-binding protein [Notoacmeibacter ruber]
MKPKTSRLPSAGIVLMALTLSCILGIQSARAETFVVEQITDVKASGAQKMFRFAPELLRLEVGDEIEFRNSIRGHTVHTIPALWPENAPPIAISYKPNATVRFPEPGVYGFKCQRHGVYGMAMLVIVGDPKKIDDLGERIDAAKLSDDAKQKLKSIISNAGLTP